jgi:hypothetical protein
MSESKLIDTFPAFLAFWETAQHQSLDDQVQGWASTYLAQWPELLEKQVQAYTEDGDDWRLVARERVVPFWNERLPVMKRAHQNLLRVCTPAYKRAQEELGFQQALTFVVYVGIGLGAGWATTYQGKRAILFGLENIAEEGWDETAVLKGLIGHEIGHLWHFDQRSGAGLLDGDGPWWQLYTEGMAQRCEFLIKGEESWHMAAQSEAWLRWCMRRKGWLAREFLRVAEEGGDSRVFFGSWFDVEGHKQTGYFLGHEAVRQLEEQMTLAEIARIEDVEAVFSEVVKAIAKNSS